MTTITRLSTQSEGDDGDESADDDNEIVNTESDGDNNDNDDECDGTSHVVRSIDGHKWLRTGSFL